jgi:sigma-B regulation protein RsbU (phosphoserine phosphatase)
MPPGYGHSAGLNRVGPKTELPEMDIDVRSATEQLGPIPGVGPDQVRDVLIVDDSRVQRKILAAQLNRAGYRVSEAGSAEEALRLCAAAMPAIIISDWMMPGLSGLDLCRLVRTIRPQDYVYFILLTSKVEAVEVATGLDAGADDFLTKPIAGEELRARIASGQRLLRMQTQLRDKNRLLETALAELQQVHEALDRDLIEARKLQQGLVRERQRHFGLSEVNLVLQPNGHVGGDLVGFFPINPRRIAVYALDVSGHGVASALMTARLAGYLQGNAPDLNIALQEDGAGGYDAIPPDQVAAQLNRIVLEDICSDVYFTMAYADIDLISGDVALVQAGHPHPLILHKDGRCERIGSGGMPVGLIDNARYDCVRVRLTPGDRLILASDGITEAQDTQGRMLGDDGLAALLSAGAAQRGRAFAEGVTERVAAYCCGVPGDDVSAVFFDFAGPEMLCAAARPAQRPVARQPVNR